MLLSELKLNPDNPRTIKQEKLEKLAQSIKDFPKMMIKRPIVYDENKVIIGGNMRYRAIQSLGMNEIPDEWVSDASDFTPDERYRFIMQDNAEMGEHDWDMVANQYELEDLEAWGIDVPYADSETEVEEDEAPEVSSEPPVSQLGVVYQLGKHRVMCGDSTFETDVETLMQGAKADMVFTDPPYNIAYEGGSKKREMIKNDIVDDFYSFLFDAYSRMFENTKAGASFYVTHADSERVNFTKAFIDAGGYLSSVIIWVKDNATFGRQDYFWKHEPILYGWNAKGSHKWLGDNKQDTIWSIDRPSRSDEHPTMKPIALITKALNNSSKQDDTVLDLFLGSGSTLIACEQTDRTCYGMELDPKYVDVIRKRYAKYTNNNELPENWEELTPEIAGK